MTKEKLTDDPKLAAALEVGDWEIPDTDDAAEAALAEGRKILERESAASAAFADAVGRDKPFTLTPEQKRAVMDRGYAPETVTSRYLYERVMSGIGVKPGRKDDQNKEKPSRDPYKGFSYSELKSRPAPKALLRTSTCIIPHGLTEIYSKPGTGKTTYTLELVTCAAAGATFHGTKLDTGRRHLYFAAEGGSGIPSRIDAVLQRNKIEEADIEGLRIVETPLDLNNENTIVAAIKANPGVWDSITIDTLAQSMSGDENSTRDVNEVVRNLKDWRDTVSAMFVLHHEPRTGDRPRGSIALDAATDCQLRLAIDGDGRTNVMVKRLRDFGLPDMPVTRFKMNRKTGLLDPDNGFGNRESRMMEILLVLYAEEPDGVAPAVWRGACDAAGGILDADTDEGRDTQWKRALGKLRIAKAIKIVGKTSAQLVHPMPPEEFAEDFEP
jgi:hypothetical protein